MKNIQKTKLTETLVYSRLYKIYRNKIVYDVRYRYYLFTLGKRQYRDTSKKTDPLIEKSIDVAKELYMNRDYIKLNSFMTKDPIAIKLINIGSDQVSEDLYTEQQAQIFASNDSI